MAVEKKELPELEKLYQRGQQNGVKDLKILDSKEIKEVEPYCEVRAISQTSLINSKQIETTSINVWLYCTCQKNVIVTSGNY